MPNAFSIYKTMFSLDSFVLGRKEGGKKGDNAWGIRHRTRGSRIRDREEDADAYRLQPLASFAPGHIA